MNRLFLLLFGAMTFVAHAQTEQTFEYGGVQRTYYLDLPAEDAERRGDFGAERYERGDMQRRVADNFRALIDGDARARPGLWHVLDARRSIEDLHAEIVKIGASRRARARARGATTTRGSLARNRAPRR